MLREDTAQFFKPIKKYKKMKYKIFVAFNHYIGAELWQVIGINNDYIGEYHKDLNSALIELSDLKTQTIKNKIMLREDTAHSHKFPKHTQNPKQ